MATTKFLALLTVTAVVAAFASSVVDTTPHNVTTQINPEDDHTATYLTDDHTSTYETDDHTSTYETTSVDFTNNDDGEDKDFLATRNVRRDPMGTPQPALYNQTRVSRKKRAPKPNLFDYLKLLAAGRNLFKGAKRAAKPTWSGTRKTWQWTKRGTFSDAVKAFDLFKCKNVKIFSGPKGISGKTGTVGNYRFTVRDGSKQGSPTLEIRSPDGKEVTKFRFER